MRAGDVGRGRRPGAAWQTLAAREGRRDAEPAPTSWAAAVGALADSPMPGEQPADRPRLQLIGCVARPGLGHRAPASLACTLDHVDGERRQLHGDGRGQRRPGRRPPGQGRRDGPRSLRGGRATRQQNPSLGGAGPRRACDCGRCSERNVVPGRVRLRPSSRILASPRRARARPPVGARDQRVRDEDGRAAARSAARRSGPRSRRSAVWSRCPDIAGTATPSAVFGAAGGSRRGDVVARQPRLAAAPSRKRACGWPDGARRSPGRQPRPRGGRGGAWRESGRAETPPRWTQKHLRSRSLGASQDRWRRSGCPRRPPRPRWGFPADPAGRAARHSIITLMDLHMALGPVRPRRRSATGEPRRGGGNEVEHSRRASGSSNQVG